MSVRLAPANSGSSTIRAVYVVCMYDNVVGRDVCELVFMLIKDKHTSHYIDIPQTVALKMCVHEVGQAETISYLVS